MDLNVFPQMQTEWKPNYVRGNAKCNKSIQYNSNIAMNRNVTSQCRQSWKRYRYLKCGHGRNIYWSSWKSMVFQTNKNNIKRCIRCFFTSFWLVRRLCSLCNSTCFPFNCVKSSFATRNDSVSEAMSKSDVVFTKGAHNYFEHLWNFVHIVFPCHFI